MTRPDSETSHLICAIVTPNYLSQFLILGRSLAITIPSAVVRVLVLQDCSDIEFFQQSIDDYLVAARSEADHRAITIDEVDWRSFDVESAVLFYSTLEFATSVKPALMRSFLCQGWERVTYLDPDLQVFKDFTPLLDDHSDVSLTPHIFTDIPRDGSKPSSHDILQAGFYNLGFCSARLTALPFLDWWSERLQFDCLVDPTAGYFTDQRILDLAPLKARVQTVLAPGCNVAYWNLHEREVVLDQGEWKVTFDGSTHPLYFFHFSGFRLIRSPSLSIHATRRVLGRSVPRSFAIQYDEMLQEGRSRHQDVEFTLGGATPRERIPTEWNRCLREDADVHVSAGLTLREVREEIYSPRDPSKWSTCLTCGVEHNNFGTRSRSFLAGWACHPSLEGVPNAISAFFRTPHHEFAATPMTQLSWALEHLQNRAEGNGDLAAEVMGVAAESLSEAVDLRLVGYFTYSAGFGQVARWTLQALENAGIHPALDRVFVQNDSHEYLSKLLQRNNPLATANASVLCFVNADQWSNHVMSAARVDPTVQHVEAVWAWELEHIPWRMYDLAASGAMERVHALSHWSARAMAKVLPIPVDRFAPFDLSLVDSLATPPAKKHVATRSAPYLLTTFDAKSLLSRKNPEGVLNLWQRVQADYPDLRLIVKSTSLRDMAPPELLELIDTVERTELIDEYLTDNDYFELLRNCEVFLSLHRSEGMGLTPIEAALCGLPVIYTDYGGLSEFMDEGFYPVAYDMTQVGESSHELGPYDKLAYWAEPDLDDAERQLRRALLSSTNGTTASPLELDRKKLEENLVAAQSEIVSTSLRLMRSAQSGEAPSRNRLIERLMAPLIELEEELNPPKVNPIYFRLVAMLYRTYRLFPAKVRLQVNLALKLLRNGQVDSTPQ
jgi:glycosyltransferase involved in cell wall biosynthesis